jgi:sortase A
VLRTKAGKTPSGTGPPGEPARSGKAVRAGRILRLLGTLCLVAALVVGGYLGWLLWGTGIGTAREQRHLRQEFTKLLTGTGAQGPQTHQPPARIKEGTPVGILQIPRIHLDMVVVNGTSTADLRKGPGHYLETAYPWENSGRVAIAGHRTTYLHPFWSLDKLRRGDVIRLVTEFVTFTYRVTSSRVILPSGVWVLNQTRMPTLVLTTCTPRFSATHRLVVFASR